MTAWSGSTRRDRLPPGWPAIRARILQRDGHRCTHTDHGQRCPAPATDVDHITPVSQGGTDAPANLRSLCRRHHGLKSSAEGNAARWKYRDKRPSEKHPGLI